MRLDALTRPELIFPGLEAANASTLLRTLAERLVAAGVGTDSEEIYQKLLEREQLGSTGIGSGVAIPHCKLAGLDRVALAIGMLRGGGIDFSAVDQKPVRLFFLVVSPGAAPAEHLQCLAAISKWVKVEDHVRRMLELQDPQAIFDLLTGEGR
ncbi:MAG: PTS sugar transporter subunit IIA [Thermoanaerobaculia bacterium]|nr:PTS sugar transporter subunit IIA [Thermoanaerobaculia bacterium]